MFKNLDFNNFWYENSYAKDNYEGEEITEEMVKYAENQLGYKLPESYIYLLKQRNGGMPNRVCCPTNKRTSWSDNHIQINAIFGIDETKHYSIFNTPFWIDEWEYPDVGIAICDCPSAGHDMVFLDYRECGPQGEPKVVHIDQEWDCRITLLAENFEEFITALKTEEEIENI